MQSIGPGAVPILNQGKIPALTRAILGPENEVLLRDKIQAQDSRDDAAYSRPASFVPGGLRLLE